MAKVEQVIFVILVILTLVGVTVTNFSPSLAHNYWLLVVVVFAIASIICELRHAKKENPDHKYKFTRQIIHWVGTLFTVLAVYVLLYTGRVNYEETSLVMLLIIALATFLAGIYAGWRFYLLGLFLLLSTIVAAYIEQYLWVLGGIGIVIVVITTLWIKHKKEA